jgi:RNA polymerase sigma-70 factor (ECF subfamily)
MLGLVPSSIERPDLSGPVDPESKEALLGRVAQGDKRAFSELYDQLAPRVLGLVRRLLVDHAQSEEVTQEIFLEIWQSASRFDPTKGAATTWVLTMAHRRAVDRVRASQSSRDRDVRIGIRDSLAYYGGYSHSEVASMLDVPIGTVKTRLRDGMIRLRDEMGVAS